MAPLSKLKKISSVRAKTDWSVPTDVPAATFETSKLTWLEFEEMLAYCKQPWLQRSMQRESKKSKSARGLPVTLLGHDSRTVACTAGYGLVASALAAGSRDAPLTDTFTAWVGFVWLALQVISGKPTG